VVLWHSFNGWTLASLSSMRTVSSNICSAFSFLLLLFSRSRGVDGRLDIALHQCDATRDTARDRPTNLAPRFLINCRDAPSTWTESMTTDSLLECSTIVIHQENNRFSPRDLSPLKPLHRFTSKYRSIAKDPSSTIKWKIFSYQGPSRSS